MRVLVVDDDVTVRMIIGIQLPDVEVLEASRMSEALRVAKREKPDAVLVDVRLPDGDGVELVRRLRTRAPTQRTPIVVVTAGHDPGQRADVLRAGADEYLAKPFEPEDLENLLRRIVAVDPQERKRRRAAHVERLDRGEDDLGESDLPPLAVPEPDRSAKRRWWRRSR